MLGGDEGTALKAVEDARLARVTELAREIASAPRARDVAEVTARHACIASGARTASVMVKGPDGVSLDVLAHHGAVGDRGSSSTVTLDAADLQTRVFKTGRAEWLDETSGDSSLASSVRAFAVLPLSAGGEPVATLGLAFDGPLPPEGLVRAFLVDTLADLCARALVRALRYENERSERIAAARLGVMLEAGQAIARATDAEEVLTRLSELLVPRFADWATVDLLDGDGNTRLAAIAHSELEAVECPVAPSADDALKVTPMAVLEVLRTGEPVILDDIEDLVRREEVTLARGPWRPEATPFTRSAMIIPLAARHRVLGALTLVSWREGLRYDEMDLRLAGKIGQHAALALHNAHLIEAERVARREAQTANRMKDAFLATVSHELRTPLHAILGWATLLRSGRLDEGGRARAVDTIERNARAQARLVDDVLDVSRIVSGKVSLNFGPVEVQAALRQALDVVWPTAQSKNVSLEVNIAADVGAVRADRDRLVQVYWNVLTNAVKFTPEGGRIIVDSIRHERRVFVRVTDNGRGIRSEFLPHLFEAFRQEDATTTRTHGGLGLGLSIAKQLVHLHGGAIRAHSEGEGTGATFEVELPSLDA